MVMFMGYVAHGRCDLNSLSDPRERSYWVIQRFVRAAMYELLIDNMREGIEPGMAGKHLALQNEQCCNSAHIALLEWKSASSCAWYVAWLSTIKSGPATTMVDDRPAPSIGAKARACAFEVPCGLILHPKHWTCIPVIAKVMWLYASRDWMAPNTIPIG